MKHENLNIAIDLDQLLRALKSKIIVPKKWIDGRGCMHRSVILFAKVCDEVKETKTHDITARDANSWRDARNKDGKVLYLGSARPSAYQPDGFRSEETTKSKFDNAE